MTFKKSLLELDFLLGVINIGIEPTAHQRSLRFHLIKNTEKFKKSSKGLRFDNLMLENSL